jgi:hypothetical protein
MTGRHRPGMAAGTRPYHEIDSATVRAGSRSCRRELTASVPNPLRRCHSTVRGLKNGCAPMQARATSPTESSSCTEAHSRASTFRNESILSRSGWVCSQKREGQRWSRSRRTCGGRSDGPYSRDPPFESSVPSCRPDASRRSPLARPLTEMCQRGLGGAPRGLIGLPPKDARI